MVVEVDLGEDADHGASGIDHRRRRGDAVVSMAQGRPRGHDRLTPRPAMSAAVRIHKGCEDESALKLLSTRIRLTCGRTASP